MDLGFEIGCAENPRSSHVDFHANETRDFHRILPPGWLKLGGQDVDKCLVFSFLGCMFCTELFLKRKLSLP